MEYSTIATKKGLLTEIATKRYHVVPHFPPLGTAINMVLKCIIFLTPKEETHEKNNEKNSNNPNLPVIYKQHVRDGLPNDPYGCSTKEPSQGNYAAT